jgi:hypothetical protein
MASDFVKGVLLVGAGMFWAAIARLLVPATSLGVAAILMPFGVLVGLGTFLIARFRMKKTGCGCLAVPTPNHRSRGP